MTVRNSLPFAVIPEWLILEDVSDRAIRLYAVLVRHADKEHHAHPSRRRLAKMVRCSESSLDRAMKELLSVGVMRVEKRRTEGGDWDVNEYILTPGGVTGEATGGVIDDQGGGVTTDGLNESPLEREPIERERSISFDHFYEIFPRHQGKGAAKKAWVKALTKTSPEELLTSAARYRDDPNRDPEYTCLPTTWLNQERWSDDPLPSRNGRRYEGTLDRMAHDLMREVNGDYRTNEGPGSPTVRSLPR